MKKIFTLSLLATLLFGFSPVKEEHFAKCNCGKNKPKLIEEATG